MAVFTSISLPAFDDWARQRYAIGGVDALTPISEGIENTNYRVQAGGRAYVFTVFELWDDAAVDYYAALMQHLNAAGLPVPAAVAGTDGAPRHHWQTEDGNSKPCLLVPFIEGGWREAPDNALCGKIGALLAMLHRAAATFTPQFPNPRGGEWRQHIGNVVRPHLNNENLQTLLDEALIADAHFCAAPLPTAACHCDLFRNNVLWQGDDVAAVIDFYFGGDDALLFDLAVCACDWCYRAGDGFDETLLTALLDGYQRERRLTALEKELFTDALASAATRFWLSRWHDIINPRPAQQLQPHDPAHFEHILRAARRERATLARLLRAA